MTRPYPVEFRQRALKAYETGEQTLEEVSTQFEISERTLRRWVKQLKSAGALEPKPRGGGNFSDVDIALLEKTLTAVRDATTDELTKAYNAQRPKAHRVHRSSILRALQRQGYVFKINAHDRRSRIVRTSARSETPSSAG